MAYIWDYETGAITHKLPGHTGLVTATAFLPHSPVLATASYDKRILLGEIVEVEQAAPLSAR